MPRNINGEHGSFYCQLCGKKLKCKTDGPSICLDCELINQSFDSEEDIDDSKKDPGEEE